MTERQTIDRAKHPEFGEGTVTYDNGPARFVSDSGARSDLRSVSMGGASASRSWLVATEASGKRVELDTTNRKRGIRHERVERDDGTRGWLVSLNDEQDWGFEFQPDTGAPLRFSVDEMFAGRPDDRNARSKKALERIMSEPWKTLHARAGFFFCYRSERP